MDIPSCELKQSLCERLHRHLLEFPFSQLLTLLSIVPLVTVINYFLTDKIQILVPVGEISLSLLYSWLHISGDAWYFSITPSIEFAGELIAALRLQHAELDFPAELLPRSRAKPIYYRGTDDILPSHSLLYQWQALHYFSKIGSGFSNATLLLEIGSEWLILRHVTDSLKLDDKVFILDVCNTYDKKFHCK